MPSVMYSPKIAGFLSFAIGTVILLVKFAAYLLTGSQAIFSDALESIVNVVAAIVAYFSISLSSQPADSNHPYGHGKSEFFSASFEGGLVTFAAIAIVVRAIYALVVGHSISGISEGLLLLSGATVANLLLGIYLRYCAKVNQSSALLASAEHVLSDVWNTLASLIGLLLVKYTGIMAIDPIVALLMGGYLGLIGYRIVRKSVGALLDEEDSDILQGLVRAFNGVHVPGIIKIHYTRVMRSGNYHFVDAHVIVPEFWDILHAHDEVNHFERKLIGMHSNQGEIHFHIDPCRKAHCADCDLPSCPVRTTEFKSLKLYSVDAITARKAT